MRLKGGKVLIDLSSLGDIYDSPVSLVLTNEEIKAIFEKGAIYSYNYKGNILTNVFVYNNIETSDGHITILNTKLQTDGVDAYIIYLDLFNSVFGINEL